jgi:tetratricopeptide (TPR) repeat protein
LLEALRLNSSPEVLYYKGLASFALGYVPQAKEELTSALGSSKLSAEQNTFARAALDLVRFHLNEISIDDAERAIAAANALDPQFVPAVFASATILERKNDFVSARRSYDSLLQQRPELLIAQRQLAILLSEKLPDDQRAEKLAMSLRQDFPDDPALLKVLGKIAYRRGEYREANRLLSNAATRQPGDSDLLYYLGMAQFHTKEAASAKTSLSRALAMEPNSAMATDARKALAELN